MGGTQFQRSLVYCILIDQNECIARVVGPLYATSVLSKSYR
jgi:hypothetical protein